MANIDTVIFDLDGTLVDSEAAAAQVMRTVFAEWGVVLTEDDAESAVGKTWSMAFDRLFAKYPPPIARAEAEQAVLERYRQETERHLPEVPGAVQAVRALAPHYRIGLVSGSYRSQVFHALDSLRIREHFEVVLGAEDYPRSKPAPDGYQKAMKLLGTRGGLVFEDSSAGILSARQAGLWVCAIDTVNHFGQDTSGAHARIHDFHGVDRDWVERLALSLSPPQP